MDMVEVEVEMEVIMIVKIHNILLLVMEEQERVEEALVETGEIILAMEAVPVLKAMWEAMVSHMEIAVEVEAEEAK